MTDVDASIAHTLKGVWAIAGTRVDEPYPCRCHERKYERCSAAFCPCAGRTDPPNSECCANRYGPAEVVEESRAWRIRKLRGQA